MTRPLALALVVSCAGKQPVDPTHTPAGAKPCEAMADHLVSLMQAKSTEPPSESMRATSDAITKVIVERCTTDGWTLDAQRCFLEIAKLEDGDKCAPLLTVAQREGADKAMDAALGPRPTDSP